MDYDSIADSKFLSVELHYNATENLLELRIHGKMVKSWSNVYDGVSPDATGKRPLPAPCLVLAAALRRGPWWLLAGVLQQFDDELGQAVIRSAQRGGGLFGRTPAGQPGFPDDDLDDTIVVKGVTYRRER